MSRFSIIDCAQRTPEWFAARAGRATGSKADCVLAKIKSGEAAARRDYRMQLMVERLTGQPQESGFINEAMQRGIDKEPEALGAYESDTGIIVRQTGFLAMTEYLAGCSLDGDVNDFEGLVSIKCPKSSTHLTYIKEARLPPAYQPQCTHELWVTGAKWYDFVSFDDRMPQGLQLFRVRVERCEMEKEIAAYESELKLFLREVEAEVLALSKYKAA